MIELTPQCSITIKATGKHYILTFGCGHLLFCLVNDTLSPEDKISCDGGWIQLLPLKQNSSFWI